MIHRDLRILKQIVEHDGVAEKLVPYAVEQRSSRPWSVPFLPLPSPTTSNSFIVTIHAINPLTGFREDHLLDPSLANLALETMRMISIVTRHDGFV